MTKTLKTEYRKLSDLKKLPNNPRTITREDMQKLKASIKKFWVLEARPLILSNRTGELVIIGWNMRYEACIELGIEEVPTNLIEGLSEEDEREIIIRDNVNNGEWDMEALANEWSDDPLGEWWVDISFSVEEPTAEEDDFDPIPPEIPFTVPWDLYEIGEHRLLCGDSTNIDDVNKLMNGDKADMVFTDPPYGMFLDTEYAVTDKVKWKKYDKVIWDNEDFKPELINTIFACFSYCKEIFLWGADYYAELLIEKNKWSWIVWDKKMESLDASIWSWFELCWSKQKHKRELLRILWSWFTAKEKNETRVHPTQKPIELCSWFIQNHSDKNNTIIDLFWWSGSTMVACHQLNRKCYGMELDPKYCDVIVNRMIALDPSLVIKRNWQHFTIQELQS